MKGTKMKPMKSDPNFFKFPKPLAGTISVLIMVLFSLSLCDPSHVVLDYLGPVGSFVRSMSKNHYSLLLQILYASIAVHLGEAVYAVYLCRKKGISTPVTAAWAFQTFLIGFSSLLQLVSFGNIGEKGEIAYSETNSHFATMFSFVFITYTFIWVDLFIVLPIRFYAAFAVHLGEAVYAVYLCRKKGISTPVTMAWAVQTFLIGFPSLLQLVGYKPDRKNK